MKPFILYVLIFIVSNYCAAGQQEDFRFESLGMREGLSQNNVHCILQDTDGFMWFGTKDGLNKYDGYRFTLFKKGIEVGKGLSANDIHTFSAGKDDNLWIGTSNGSLNLLNLQTEQFQHILFKNVQGILTTYTDKKGNLWIGTKGGGLYRYQPAIKKLTQYTQLFHSGLPNGDYDFCHIIESSDGKLWLGTSNDGAFLFDPTTKQFRSFHSAKLKSGLSFNRIQFVFEDKNKNIWVGTYGKGLYFFNPQTHAFVKYNLSNNTHKSPSYLLCMEEDTKGNLWIGSENEGLWVLNPTTGNSSVYKPTENDHKNISSNTINCIYKDRAGNMWIGTSDAGINIVAAGEKSFAHYSHNAMPGSLSNNIVNSFFQDQSNYIWIGTDGGGINKFDEKTGTFQVFKNKPGNSNSLCGNYVLSASQDNNSNIWVGTWGNGISIISPDNRVIKHLKKTPDNQASLSSNYVFCLLKDSKGRMWVGTYGGGLDLYDEKTGNFIHHKNIQNDPSSISSNHILSIQEDKDANLWIGTDGGGLNRLDESSHRFISAPYQKAGISNDRISSIYADPRGYIWLSTDFGLNRFDPRSGKNRVFLTKEGLASDVTTSVKGDNEGNIWVSTNKGISKLLPDGDVINYTIDDGLQQGEFRQGSLLSKSGCMFFGGKDGFNSFVPEKMTKAKTLQPIVFTGFQIFNQPVIVDTNQSSQHLLPQVISKTKSIDIPYQLSVLSFDFSPLAIASKHNVQFRYMLKGLEDTWKYLGTKNSVTFTNLDPGKYVLQVRCRVGNGNWSDISQLKLNIILPFWKTWWFRTFVILLVIGSIVFYFYQRMITEKKKARALEIMIADKTQSIRIEESHKENTIKTEKKQQHILEQKQDLELTVRDLEQSNNSKDKFFSILAHDLNNPVTALHGYSSDLNNRWSDLSKEDIQKHIKDIYTASASVKSLVSNLLNWTGSNMHQITCTPEVFDLQELISKNLQLVQLQLNSKNITVSVHSATMQKVLADPQMADAIIRNLLSNCIKFSPKGAKICITSISCESWLALIFNDYGVGITEERLKELETDRKVNPSEGTYGEKGMGLGLQIVKEFIQLNKGHLYIKSQKGNGSTFTILLPLVAEHSQSLLLDEKLPLSNNTVSLLQQQSALLKGKRVLIVDDNTEIRNYLKLLLSETFEIFEAADGKEGLKTSLEIQPDLVITDIVMPSMNGLEFCKQLKTDYNTSHIPVILITGNKEQTDELNSFEAGADAFLKKPFDQKVLFQIILNLIRQQDNAKRKYTASKELYPESASNTNKLDIEFLDKVTKYIEENLADTDLDYKKISEFTAMSRTTLYAKFKTLTGLGVHDFIKNIRLKKSIQLLQERSLNISQIAYEVGFSTPSYFTKSFQKKYQMSPRDYLNAIQNSNLKENPA